MGTTGSSAEIETSGGSESSINTFLFPSVLLVVLQKVTDEQIRGKRRALQSADKIAYFIAIERNKEKERDKEQSSPTLR